MSRRRRTAIGAAFSPRRIDMLESPAYRALSLSAHRVIDRIAIELMHHGGADNGRLIVTYDDFERYGIHRRCIRPAIQEAAALGFIEITRQGRAGNAEFRTPNLFRLTFARSDHEAGDGTHEWMSISEANADAIAAAARKPKPRKKSRKNKRKTKPRKTKSQWQKTTVLGGENHTENGPIHSAETATTEHSAETATTVYISGRDAA